MMVRKLRENLGGERGYKKFKMKVEQGKASLIVTLFQILETIKELSCVGKNTDSEKELSSQPHSVSQVSAAPALSPEFIINTDRPNEKKSVGLKRNMSLSSLIQPLPSCLTSSFLSSLYIHWSLDEVYIRLKQI